MFDTLITGGTVVNAEGERKADIAIANGRIAALLSPGETAGARTHVDAAGKYLLPGLIDAHAHLREPGLTHKENFDSGTKAAALGGVTTVLDMPTDEPWTATGQQLRDKMELAKGRLNVDVGFQGVMSKDMNAVLEMLKLRPVSLELFTADVPSAYLFDSVDSIQQILQKFGKENTVIGISPGDQSILSGSEARDRAGGIQAFLSSRPPLAEANGIARAVLAAAQSSARIHIRQINSLLGLGVWRRLKEMADATVETTPQNLFFTADDYEVLGANLKGSPPLRGRDDVQALRAALSEGLIDIVATDHAPHSAAEKATRYGTFAEIPGGMPGLQTLLPVMLKLVDERVIKLTDLVRMCALAPAQRFGLGRSKGAIATGYDADIVIIDRNRKFRITNAQQVSRAAYTPFDGWTVPSELTDVFLRGRAIVSQGSLVSEAQGQVIARQD
ncbi:dihydroorotase [Phyllobacterium sp. 1468]|uniref:dihydroorotase n=1 Tax=Phyllobacterium sp. 1468 TaxID=2817759 RepID=UPI00285632A2|nr:dihydroorotase family protein [Phyllobacterium sp. 1468]MDR6634596.1 dihydroorotase [Phyllobacterium sp. 1468]